MPILDARAGPSYGTAGMAEHADDEVERQRLLRAELAADSPESETSTINGGVQEGVRKIEAISKTWTTRGLVIAYIGSVHHFGSYTCVPLLTYAGRIFLMAFCTSLEGQTVMSLSAYATSAFSRHSLISTVLVVQNVVNGKRLVQRCIDIRS